MAVYISLVAAVLILAAFVKNSAYTDGHIYGTRKYGTDRQQAINITSSFGIYLLLAGVSACRIAVGNDYWVYRENFKLIYMGRDVASEPGFNFIVYWMQKLFGYNNYLPIFGLFSFITVAFMIKSKSLPINDLVGLLLNEEEHLDQESLHTNTVPLSPVSAPLVPAPSTNYSQSHPQPR